MTPKLDPHQEEAVRRLVASKKGFLLADEPGVGKTPPAIRAAAELRARTVLVLCPAVARENWRREFERWAPEGRWTVGVDREDADVRIISYDLAVRDQKLRRGLLGRKFDILICDEAHYLKAPASKRTVLVYGQYGTGPENGRGLAARATRVWLLTGTPTPNYANELWVHLRALWPELISIYDRPMREAEFTDTFCKTRQGRHRDDRTVVENKKGPLRQLRDRMRPYVLRRLYAKVYPGSLPPRVSSVPLSGDFTAVAKAMEETFSPEMQDSFHRALARGDDAALDWMGKHVVSYSTMRRHVGLAKADAAATYIREMLDGGVAKVVVFAHHRDVISRLADALCGANPRIVSGATSPKDKQAAIDAFQNDPSVRVMIGQTVSMGTAVTLTAAHHVVFVEPSWVPSDNRQAVGRCHRRGQKNRVLVTLLHIPRSVDAHISDLLARKTSGIKDLWDANPDTNQEKETA